LASDVLAATDYPDGSRDEWTTLGLRRRNAHGKVVEERLATPEEWDQVQAAIDVRQQIVANRQRAADLAAGIAALQDALVKASALEATATARAAAADTMVTELAARATLVRGVTNPTAAQLRDEIGLLYDKMGVVATALGGVSTGQAQTARGISLAFQDLIYLAEMAQDPA
jgi:hypothetical protein